MDRGDRNQLYGYSMNVGYYNTGRELLYVLYLAASMKREGESTSMTRPSTMLIRSRFGTGDSPRSETVNIGELPKAKGGRWGGGVQTFLSVLCR